MNTLGFVLVHGGHLGAWCWDRVQPLLEEPSVAVELPGRGRRPATGRVTLAACVEAVLEDAAAAGLGQFVLVGHSLGGLTITETAFRHPDRVAHLVYLAALAVEPGRTVLDLFYPANAPAIDPCGSRPYFAADVAHRMFAGDLTDEEYAVVHERCHPEPNGLFLETVSGYGPAPLTYVRCRRDGASPPSLVRSTLAVLSPTDVRVMDADHNVMLSHPDDLAVVLNDIASGVVRSLDARTSATAAQPGWTELEPS